MNNWTKLIDNKALIDIIFVCLTGAFDSTPRKRILFINWGKLAMGPQFWKDLMFFFSNKHQVFRVVNSISNSVLITVVWPNFRLYDLHIFFILYMDGVFDNLLTNNLNLYANDAKLYGSVLTSQQHKILKIILQKGKFSSLFNTVFYL